MEMAHDPEEFASRVFVAITSLEDRLGQRMDRIEQKLDATRDEMHSHFDTIYQRLDLLKTEYHMLVEAVRRVEASLVEIGVDRAAMRREIEALKERVAVLEARLNELDADTHDA